MVFPLDVPSTFNVTSIVAVPFDEVFLPETCIVTDVTVSFLETDPPKRKVELTDEEDVELIF